MAHSFTCLITVGQKATGTHEALRPSPIQRTSLDRMLNGAQGFPADAALFVDPTAAHCARYSKVPQITLAEFAVAARRAGEGGFVQFSSRYLGRLSKEKPSLFGLWDVMGHVIEACGSAADRNG